MFSILCMIHKSVQTDIYFEHYENKNLSKLRHGFVLLLYEVCTAFNVTYLHTSSMWKSSNNITFSVKKNQPDKITIYFSIYFHEYSMNIVLLVLFNRDERFYLRMILIINYTKSWNFAARICSVGISYFCCYLITLFLNRQ